MRRAHLVIIGVTLLAVASGACTRGGGDPPADLGLGERATVGVEVARQRGCAGCHSTDGDRGSGPSWKGIWGSEVELGSGGSVSADADYIRRSITDPRSAVVEGFANIMPVYDDLDDDELASLLAYICMLGNEPDPAFCESQGG